MSDWADGLPSVSPDWSCHVCHGTGYLRCGPGCSVRASRAPDVGHERCHECGDPYAVGCVAWERCEALGIPEPDNPYASRDDRCVGWDDGFEDSRAVAHTHTHRQ